MRCVLSMVGSCIVSAVLFGSTFAFLGAVLWMFGIDLIAVWALGTCGLALGLLQGIGAVVTRKWVGPDEQLDFLVELQHPVLDLSRDVNSLSE